MHVAERLLSSPWPCLPPCPRRPPSCRPSLRARSPRGDTDVGGLYFGLTDLSGQRFTATFVYDTTLGTRSTLHRGTEDSIVGTTRVDNVLSIALRASGVVVPNLDLPLALTDDHDFFQRNFVFARTDVGSGIRTAYASPARGSAAAG